MLKLTDYYKTINNRIILENDRMWRDMNSDFKAWSRKRKIEKIWKDVDGANRK